MTLLTLPQWPFYGLLVIFLTGFFKCASAICRNNFFKGGGSKNAPTVVMLLTSGIASLAVADHLFSGFHTITIKDDRIALVYSWPRMRREIPRDHFQSIRVIRDRKQSGYAVITHLEGETKSVSFSRSVRAEEIAKALNEWKTGSL